MSDERTLPIFIGVGDEQLQIGTMVVSPRGEKTFHLLADIAVFAGERLSFSRVVDWEETVRFSHYLYRRDKK